MYHETQILPLIQEVSVNIYAVRLAQIFRDQGSNGRQILFFQGVFISNVSQFRRQFCISRSHRAQSFICHVCCCRLWQDDWRSCLWYRTRTTDGSFTCHVFRRSFGPCSPRTQKKTSAGTENCEVPAQSAPPILYRPKRCKLRRYLEACDNFHDNNNASIFLFLKSSLELLRKSPSPPSSSTMA
jgi:hypothetical protein